jgi:1-acyl-sn-glycerol-3-phosphate acyltransferase
MARYGRLYPIAKALITPSTKFLFPTRVTGLHHVCASGPAMIAPNHISFFDSVVLIGVLPRRITYVGKAEYLESWKTRYVLPAMGMIPIERGSGKRSMEALDTAAGVLERGELFGIFPEGTRSRDGMLHKGRAGLARLAIRTGAPIIPVGIRGTDKVQPPGSSVPRPFVRCEVHFGRPIEMSRYAGRSLGAATYRSITDEVMYEISQLSGQTYVDRYADRPAPSESPPSEPALTRIDEPSLPPTAASPISGVAG